MTEAAAPINRALIEVCQTIGSSLELGEVLDTILDHTVREMGAGSASLLLYEPGSEDLRMLASRGLPEEVVQRGYVPRKGSIAERVIQSNEPLVLTDKVDDSKRGIKGMDNGQTAIRSSMCVPLHAKGQVIGTLNLNRYDARLGPFSDTDLDTAMILASQAAISIENARLYESNLKQERLAAIGQTVAGISHCVKNMLTGLRGGLGLVELAQQSENWDACGKGSALLRRSVERISLLVLDMLDYSREKKPQRRRVPVAKPIDEVLDVTRYKAEKLGVTQSSEIAEGCEEILLDPDQFFRCLLNLVENAVDALDSGGHVCVRCVQTPREELETHFPPNTDFSALLPVFEVRVEDNGPGIPEEIRENIFKPFFSTKESKGTGLGLAVTRKITEEHGGRVVLESDAENGTVFRLLFPQAPWPEELEEQPAGGEGA